VDEQKDIEKAAREKEQARDEASREADELLERHHHFANSVAFIQVAIALVPSPHFHRRVRCGTDRSASARSAP